MSEIKLSGKFQPNVYLDFGQGKIFGNRWAHGYIPFDTVGWEKTEGEPLYVYAENENGSSLYNTGIECPSTLMCIDPNGEKNIKIDVFKGIELTKYGEILRLDKYNFRFEYLESLSAEEMTDEMYEEYCMLYDEIFTTQTDPWGDDDSPFLTPIHKTPGVNYNTKEPKGTGDLLTYDSYEFSTSNSVELIEYPVVIRPQALCMPMIRPVRKVIDGTEYYLAETEVEDGDTYTITVLPNKFTSFCEDKISNTVFLFADKRRLMAESYTGLVQTNYIFEKFCPDSTIVESDEYGNIIEKENIDYYSGRFKINGEFADLILLRTGTTITLKAVYDHVTIDGEEKNIVYWNVENHNAFKKFTHLEIYDISLAFTHKELTKGHLQISPQLVTYCSNVYYDGYTYTDETLTSGQILDVEEIRTPIQIDMNTRDNCFENAFYLQDNSWWY